MEHLDPKSRLQSIPELKWLRTMIMERALTRGDYLLAGGARSDYYIDKFRLFSDPAILRRIARMFTPIVTEIQPHLIAGTELGGVIVAPRASELILGVSLAVEQQLTVDQVAQTFAVYPSLTGSITEAARKLMLPTA